MKTIILILMTMMLIGCRGMIVIEMEPNNYSIEITSPTETGYGFGVYSAEETTPTEVTKTTENSSDCTPPYSSHTCTEL
jgi:hypothetical protein